MVKLVVVLTSPVIKLSQPHNWQIYGGIRRYCPFLVGRRGARRAECELVNMREALHSVGSPQTLYKCGKGVECELGSYVIRFIWIRSTRIAWLSSVGYRSVCSHIFNSSFGDIAGYNTCIGTKQGPTFI